MGIAFVLLGLLAAATVVDFLIENELSAADQSYALFGGTFTLSQAEVVIAAAVLGALALLFLGLGLGLARGSWGRRRAMRHRMKDLERETNDLERENADLRARTPDTVVISHDEVPGGRPEVHAPNPPEMRADRHEEVPAHRRG